MVSMSIPPHNIEYFGLEHSFESLVKFHLLNLVYLTCLTTTFLGAECCRRGNISEVKIKDKVLISNL